MATSEGKAVGASLLVEQKMDVVDYLKKPYGRLVVPEEDGSYRAEIIEFPGCIALEETASAALAALEEIAAAWLEAALAKGQQIPEPIENTEYSGKFVLRLSKSLHKKAAYAAERDGVSLNQFIVTAVASHFGAIETMRTVPFYENGRGSTLTFMDFSGARNVVITGAATSGSLILNNLYYSGTVVAEVGISKNIEMVSNYG